MDEENKPMARYGGDITRATMSDETGDGVGRG